MKNGGQGARRFFVSNDNHKKSGPEAAFLFDA